MGKSLFLPLPSVPVNGGHITHAACQKKYNQCNFASLSPSFHQKKKNNQKSPSLKNSISYPKHGGVFGAGTVVGFKTNYPCSAPSHSLNTAVKKAPTFLLSSSPFCRVIWDEFCNNKMRPERGFCAVLPFFTFLHSSAK